jgi:Dolichyl-phosphate-mannose-protein mannosyltransferase
VVDRKLDELQGRSQRLPERPVGHPAGSLPVGESAPAGRGWSASVAGLSPRALWKSHRLFSILVILSLLPRVLADLAFRPALLIPDSFGYMQEGTTLSLGRLRPSGYPILLHLLGPFHSLLLVTALQHLLGISTAVIVYGLLRCWGLPAWGGALATAPTLFDPRQIALESYILPDAVFSFVVVAAAAVLLTRRKPGVWQCVGAGLGIAYASLLRGNGLLLIVPILGYMLVRRVGLRAFAAGAVAFVIPMLGYASLFHADYGTFNITNSDGLFLWARTTSFADCAVIKPPADLVPLCPDRQGVRVPVHVPAWSLQAMLAAPTPADYLWSSGVWWKHTARPGPTAANNSLAMRFAIDAIETQPLDYLRVASRDVLLTFVGSDRRQDINAMAFTARPEVSVLPPNYTKDLRDYAHTSAVQHAVQPYAYFLFLYQQPVFFPGLVFLAVVLAGLAGVIRNWRRWGGPGALPWTAAAITIVAPAALVEDLYRYAIVAVPLACLAAGLAFVPAPRNLDPEVPQAAVPISGGPDHAMPCAGPVTEDHGNAE